MLLPTVSKEEAEAKFPGVSCGSALHDVTVQPDGCSEDPAVLTILLRHMSQEAGIFRRPHGYLCGPLAASRDVKRA